MTKCTKVRFHYQNRDGSITSPGATVFDSQKAAFGWIKKATLKDHKNPRSNPIYLSIEIERGGGNEVLYVPQF